MNRVVLPGHGTPATFNVPEDSTVGVFSNGRMFTVSLKANVPTRVEFVKSLSAVEVPNSPRRLALVA